MRALWLVLVLVAAVLVLIYVLYQNGIGVLNSKAALLYRATPGGQIQKLHPGRFCVLPWHHPAGGAACAGADVLL